MGYPLIILGAGASHDYSPYGQKPPLTKDLVQEIYIDKELLVQYPEVSNLISTLWTGVNRDKKSFEVILDEIQQQSQNNPNRKIQIVILQIYLQELFGKISANFQKVNHYKTIQGRISDCFSGGACVVSFNYDTLFENSIIGNPFNKIRSYINGPIELIKPHGSHDWRYVRRLDSWDFDEYKNAYSFLKQNPGYFEESSRGEYMTPYHYEEANKRPEFLHLPALAVPLPNKQKWICPETHIQRLKQALEKIDRILIIGWRAADSNLLDLIATHVNKNVRAWIVSGTNESASEIASNISKKTGLQCQISPESSAGFSGFIDSPSYNSFFN